MQWCDGVNPFRWMCVCVDMEASIKDGPVRGQIFLWISIFFLIRYFYFLFIYFLQQAYVI